MTLLAAVSVPGCGSGSDGDPSSAGFSDSCPYWSADSRWIAFDRGPGGVATLDDRGRWAELESDVHVVSADGRRLVRLTRTPAQDEVLGWVAQPPAVVYRNRNGVFAIAPRSGAKPQRLGALRPDDEVVALSHDGHRAFVVQGNRAPPGSDPLDEQETYAEVVVDLVKQTRHELARGPGIGVASAAWTPDDAALAYSRDRAAFPRTELVIVRADRVALRRRVVSISGLGWSPDGRRLAYSAMAVGGAIDEGAHIWLLRLSDGSASQLTHRSEVEDTDPIWSRDGKQIYYQSSGTLRSITPAGTNDREIVGENAVCPALSPDSTRIAFNRTERAGYFTRAWSLLMVMQADGSDKSAITAAANP